MLKNTWNVYLFCCDYLSYIFIQFFILKIGFLYCISMSYVYLYKKFYISSNNSIFLVFWHSVGYDTYKLIKTVWRQLTTTASAEPSNWIISLNVISTHILYFQIWTLQKYTNKMIYIEYKGSALVNEKIKLQIVLTISYMDVTRLPKKYKKCALYLIISLFALTYCRTTKHCFHCMNSS